MAHLPKSHLYPVQPVFVPMHHTSGGYLRFWAVIYIPDDRYSLWTGAGHWAYLFKPFQDDFSALSMPPTNSKSHSASDTDSSSGSSSCSPPNDSQSLSVMHRDGLISGTSLASPASPHKPLGSTGANSIAKTKQSAGTTSKSTRKMHAKASVSPHYFTPPFPSKPSFVF